ncbi:MAG: adenylate/guanylate cyclase domain-containing protein [Limisphaerales bacterium]
MSDFFERSGVEGFPETVISSIRHGLRTPLNQILGYSEMLEEELGDVGGGVDLGDLRKIHQAGSQLLALVNEHFGTARVRAGKLDLEGLRRDGRTLLNLIIGYSELCAEEWEVLGQARLAEDLGRIRKAAGNLLSVLHDEELLRPLLEHGAGVRAEGDGVRGARVGVAAVQPSARALVGRLLVVDDSEMNRDMLSRRLERQGHTVLLAENGKQALELLRANRVDVILLDILMPEMDGLETLGRIKEDEQTRDTPVIMLSALDELDAVVGCIERGADDYLQKPFNPVLLSARLNACLEKKRLRDQERAFFEQLQVEREKSEHLLRNILPVSIAERLKAGETTIADAFEDVTVLFADLVEFTKLAAVVPAPQLVSLLNEVFSQFDWLAELHGVEKIKTIGDAYMVVGGLPVAREDHAGAVAAMALDMLKVAARVEVPGGGRIGLRLGISTGPVVAGIIGSKKFIYDLWGDTVNLASRMESHGELGRIHVSASTYEQLRGRYVFEERGLMEIKGKGLMPTYFLKGLLAG